MKNIILFIIFISSSVGSSVLWKISSNQLLKISDVGNLFLTQITNLWYILGWLCYMLATFLWIYLLSQYEFSRIYPVFVGSCIILSLITGLFFFRENTDMIYKIVGATLIICGTILVVKH